MSELKPCPFCGSGDVDAEGWLNGQGQRGPECLECGATAQSAEAWNRRTPPEGMTLVPREITAESGHKAGMIGDFIETIEDCCPECGGSGWDDGEDCDVCEGRGGWYRKVAVEWTTIKAIHRRVIEIAEEVPS